MPAEAASADEITFLEPNAQGGVALDSAPPSGEPCGACGAPVESSERYCGACGTANPRFVDPTAVAAAPARHLKCDNCGAEIVTQQDQRSYTCPFCDSTYVLEVPATDDRPAPEFVIGFAVTSEQAEQIYRRWISDKSWFHPSDLSQARLADRLRGVYLPFWHFAMLAESEWQAQIGEHWYRTETYTERGPDGKTVTKTRRVQETEWWPLAGRHHRYYSGHLVSAAAGLPQAEAEQVMPYRLEALKRFDPSYLAGWGAEEASVDRETALARCREEFERRARRHVAEFLPGDTHRNLQLATRFGDATSDLCLLPIYLMNYRYGGKEFRFLINGQTGAIAGKKPYSSTRIAIAVVVGIVAVGMVVATIAAIAGLFGAMNR